MGIVKKLALKDEVHCKGSLIMGFKLKNESGFNFLYSNCFFKPLSPKSQGGWKWDRIESLIFEEIQLL